MEGGTSAEQAEESPAESVTEPDNQPRDGKEQRRSPCDLRLPQMQPRGESQHRQCHREREIEKSVLEGKGINERQSANRKGRDTYVQRRADCQNARCRQQLGGKHDRSHCQLEPQNWREPLDQQVRAEIADQLPSVAEIGLQFRPFGQLGLDRVAS